MKKLLFIFGTRPETIKLAPLIVEAKKKRKIKTIVCVTAQHRQMLDQMLNVFKIKPDHDLNLMIPNQTLSEITSNCILQIDKIIKSINPDCVIVQGDTTTAFSAALSAYYNKINVAHIEAGLRSFDKYQPFPEELNRKFVANIADYHFVATEFNKINLLKENVLQNKIYVVGNTVIDALNKILDCRVEIKQNAQLSNIDFTKKIIVFTCHRRENFGGPLIKIFTAIKKIAAKYKNIEIIYPVHLNPNIQSVIHYLYPYKNIHIIPPLTYLEFVHIMKKAYLLISDSGGIQEEAPTLNKPALILRNKTERPEAIISGTSKLVGTTSINKIYNAIEELLINSDIYMNMINKLNPFGDGTASKRIIKVLENI